MDHLERVLDERAGDLAVRLAAVGFSRDEARRFLVGAGRELVEAYAWHVETHDSRDLETPAAASELLAWIRGRALAIQIGLSTEKTWAGLREFVPAVLDARHAEDEPGGSASRDGPRARSFHAGGPHFELGFGLRLVRIRSRVVEGDQSAGRVNTTHPIFCGFLSPQE